MMNPSVGGLATVPPVDAGMTYLILYRVSFAFLLSLFLLTKVLGDATPSPVVPSPTMVEKMLFSVAAVATLTYHWFSVTSYWTGWPISPEFLSETLLTTLRTPPFSLTAIAGDPLIASLRVLASLILTLVVMPPDVFASVIAK